MSSNWKRKPTSSFAGAGGSRSGTAAAGALFRLVSDLRSDRAHRGSSLVVRTGFPTSLADIVVKNRGRLRKPSRNNKRDKPLDPDPSSSSSDDLPAVSDEDFSLRSSEIRRSPADVPVRPRSPICGEGRRGIWEFRVVFVALVVLIALASERRKLVAGITIAAVGFRLLDFLGFRIGRFLRFDSKGNGEVRVAPDLNLAVVSPIREVGIDGFSVNNRVEDDSLSEREKPDRESTECYGVSSEKKKKKKLFRKFSLKSFRSKKGNKYDKLLNSDVSVAAESNCTEEMVETEEESVKEEIYDETGNGNAVTDHETEHPKAVQECVGVEVDSRCYLKLAFFSIILVGLVGGKGVALVLTVSWFLLSKTRNPCGGGEERDCNE